MIGNTRAELSLSQKARTRDLWYPNGLQTVAGTALTWANIRALRHFGTHLT
jgi:hypothetical protein